MTNEIKTPLYDSLFIFKCDFVKTTYRFSPESTGQGYFSQKSRRLEEFAHQGCSKPQQLLAACPLRNLAVLAWPDTARFCEV